MRRRVLAVAAAATLALLIAGCAEPPPRTDADAQPIDDLLDLIKSRLEAAGRAAHETWVTGAGPRDDRIANEELLDAAVNRASEYTLPPEVVREFLSGLMEAASHVQSSLHAQWQAKPESRPRPAAADAVRTQSGGEPSSGVLLSTLARAYPVLRKPGGKDLLIKRAEKTLAGLPGGVKTALLALRPLASVAH